MNPPKMPIHIGDFLRDTGHLRAAGTGGYLLLLFHYWSTGSLPDDDDQLAAVARMSRSEWKKMRPILERFFKPGWRHGRVEEDLVKARESYEKRAAAGSKGGQAKAENKQSASNATALSKLPLTLNLSSEPKGSGEVADQDVELFRRGKQVLGASAGGMIAKLKAHFGGSVAKTRAAIETASTKDNPKEYVGRILHGPQDDGYRPTSGAII